MKFRSLFLSFIALAAAALVLAGIGASPALAVPDLMTDGRLDPAKAVSVLGSIEFGAPADGAIAAFGEPAERTDVKSPVSGVESVFYVWAYEDVSWQLLVVCPKPEGKIESAAIFVPAGTPETIDAETNALRSAVSAAKGEPDMAEAAAWAWDEGQDVWALVAQRDGGIIQLQRNSERVMNSDMPDVMKKLRAK